MSRTTPASSAAAPPVATALLVAVALLAADRTAAYCPCYTLSSPANTYRCGIEAVPGTNPSVAEWNAIFLRVSGGPKAWGEAGPAVSTLTVGCGKPSTPSTTDPLFPCELLQAIAMQESSWRQFCAPDRPADQAGKPSRTIISFDCGYGTMQITSNMHVGETASWDRERVASDPLYNAATGGLFLRSKWQATTCVGDRQLQVVEDWYTATWAYNGLTYSNNPNNPAYSSVRRPYDPLVGGAHPYQEKVWGWLEHPPSASHWPALSPAYPDRIEIGTATRPPDLSEPACAGPTDCANRRPTHLSACLPSAGATTSLFVPVVLAVAGMYGSYFTTELALTNRGTSEANVTYVYTASLGGGSGSASETLAAGRQRIVSDIVAHLRALGLPIPEGGDRLGTLHVRFEGLSSAAAAAVTARTTTALPEGRAGLAYAGIGAGALLSGSATVFGLRQSVSDRANLALTSAGEPGSGDVTLRVTLVSGDPSAPGSTVLPDVTLPPGGFFQLSSPLAEAGFAQGLARIERVAGTAPWYAFGVVNDNATSDGSFVPPSPDGAAPSALLLPALVEAGPFRSELVVANRATAPVAPRMTWVADGLAAGSVSFDLPLLAGEQRILADAVQMLRERGVAGIPPAGATLAGALFAPAEGGMLLAARTAAPGKGGLFGTFTPAIASGAEATDEAWLYGLRQDAENRSNVALIHAGGPGDGPLSLALEIHDGDTGARAATVAVPPLEARRFVQLNALLAAHAPGVTNAYVRVVRTAGTSPFVAYAVVNDGGSPGERTGDGAYVSMGR